MAKKIDPKISQYMSELAKKRKNPYLNFKDKEAARKAGLKSGEVRRANKETSKSQEKLSRQDNP